MDVSSFQTPRAATFRGIPEQLRDTPGEGVRRMTGRDMAPRGRIWGAASDTRESRYRGRGLWIGQLTLRERSYYTLFMIIIDPTSMGLVFRQLHTYLCFSYISRVLVATRTCTKIFDPHLSVEFWSGAFCFCFVVCRHAPA